MKSNRGGIKSGRVSGVLEISWAVGKRAGNDI